MKGIKLPPHDIDAEEAVNGSLLLGGDVKILTLIPDDFYSEQNSIIFRACQEMTVPINQITLAHALGNNLNKVGGAAYLSHLITVTPTPYDMTYYAKIVKDCSVRRQMLSVADKLSGLCDSDMDTAAILSQADDLILKLRKKADVSDIVTPQDRIKLIADRYTNLYNVEDGAALGTGLTDLDRYIGGGFYKGDLVLVAARPSMGKTALLRTMTNNIATRGKTCAFVSLEMSSDALADRDIAGITGVDINVIRHGNYTPELYAKIMGEGLDAISRRNIYEYDNPFATTETIMQFCISIKERYGLDIVFIDYLGLLSDTSRENEVVRLGNISRKLKGMARKLDIPVVAAHQLSRGLEMRAESDKEPKLQDLRGSGRLEEDADVVLFIHRENYYDRLSTDTTTGIIIAKQRQGESNIRINTAFDKPHQRYVNIYKGKI